MAGSPFRSARAWWAAIFLSAARACSARYSCTKPITAFKITIATIATVSAGSPRNPAITAAASRTTIMKSVNCAAKIRQRLLGLASRIEFGPCRARREETSSLERPRSSVVWSCCSDRFHGHAVPGDRGSCACALPGLAALTGAHLLPKHAKQCQGYGQNHGTE